jgi:hypothetical protein
MKALIAVSKKEVVEKATEVRRKRRGKRTA